jgi:hypothetical protein
MISTHWCTVIEARYPGEPFSSVDVPPMTTLQAEQVHQAFTQHPCGGAYIKKSELKAAGASDTQAMGLGKRKGTGGTPLPKCPRLILQQLGCKAPGKQETMPPACELQVCTDCPMPTAAIIYAWTFTPPFEHVLKGRSYYGQTLQPIEKRTRDHKLSSAHHSKEVGLHALWKQYPHDDQWTVRVLERRQFESRVKACEWMNVEEKRLIRESGGILKDMDSSRKQTLNLTVGGQGDPRKQWEYIHSRSRKQLKPVWEKLEEFFKANGTLHVPVARPVLGAVVNNIRHKACFLQHVDFKKWLDERGFVYNVQRAHLDEVIWPAFEEYYNSKGNLRISLSHPGLGNVVHDIRSKRCHLQYADFKKWLDERGFVYDERRAHLDEVIWPAFKAYFDANQTLRSIPRSHPMIGQVVHGIRTQGVYLQHADFKEWLGERGFVYDERRAHLDEAIWPAFRAYFDANQTLRNIPRSHPALGLVINHIRTKGHFLIYRDFVQWLWRASFQMHTRDALLNRTRWASVLANFAPSTIDASSS